jgi:hypothetical protein
MQADGMTFSAYRKTDKKKWQFWFWKLCYKKCIMAGADAFNR